MGKLRCSCVLLCTFSLAALGVQPSSSTGTEAIRGVVARYMQARNHKDAAAIRALFTQDADQLVSTGKWRRGVDRLVRGAMASSQKEAGNSSIAIEHIRLLDPEIAIV
ncbi:MAG: SgcJ/EcaC family oxidoreductase, partial [Candidatus Acidiferrales bacterium]